MKLIGLQAPFVVCAVGFLFWCSIPVAGQPASDAASDSAAAEQGTGSAKPNAGHAIDKLLDMDMAQLSKVDVVAPAMDIPVTSVAKQESTIGRSPAAVFVITSEMIHRSGATCIPEVLRMVPGLEVARVNSNAWVITARGFSDRFANKLLVLIDGRTVYTPLFSGVYWDSQDLLLEEIDRIEVIRGPGGTLWGANAVNGVINIMTKSSKETQGILVTAGGGDQDRIVDGLRYGNRIGDGFTWRVYGKHFERGPGYTPAGIEDDWRIGRGGFRVDWELDPCQCNQLTVQGDYYGGTIGENMLELDPASPNFLQRISPDEEISGANVLARWTHVIDDTSDWSFQMYYDRTLRNQPIIRQEIQTIDVDFQHRFPLGTRHGLIWGFDFRQVQDDLSYEPFYVTVVPPKRKVDLFSVFLQDEITIVEDRFFFTVGTKLEHNEYTGFEYQPSARVLYTPDPKHSLWGAISRAVRVPSRFEQDGAITLEPDLIDPAPVYLFPRYTGNRNLVAEALLAYEIGYRTQATDRFSYDIAAFYNTYEDLLAFDTGTPYPYGTNLILPLDLASTMFGDSYGIEIAADWKVTDWWRLAPSYTYLQIELDSPSSVKTDGVEQSSPHNQVFLRSYCSLARRWDLDMAFRYVDNLPNQHIGAYLTMDIRLAWFPRDNVELELVGRNLFDHHHAEYGQDSFNFLSSESSRNIFARATWRY